jgi:precorrin-6B methylase 1
MNARELHDQLGQLLREFPESGDALVVCDPDDGGPPEVLTLITFNGDAAQVQLTLE